MPATIQPSSSKECTIHQIMSLQERCDSYISKARLVTLASLLLLFLVLFGLSPQNSYSATTTNNGVSYSYYEENGSIAIDGISSSGNNYTAKVPAMINGKPVEEISFYGDRGWRISLLDLRACSALKKVVCGDNRVTSIDVSGCSQLKSLSCAANGLTSLKLSGCTSLVDLSCDDNSLKSLDVSSCPNLKSLTCAINRLTMLDISKNAQLTELDCFHNYISNTTALEKWASQSGHKGDVSPQFSGKWVHGSKGWWYRYGDTYNNWYATGWLELKSGTYYLDSKGWMKTGWQKISNKWYYFNKSGAMAKGWKKVGKSWYYLDSDGVMQTGKKTISGKTYYLKSSGAMKTGWSKENNKWFYYNKSGAMQTSKWIGNYYVGSDGVMATNTWIGEYHVNSKGKWDATRALAA